MSDTAHIGNLYSLAEHKRRRDAREPRSLMDVHRDIGGLPVGHPRRARLLAESAAIVRARQADVRGDGPEAA